MELGNLCPDLIQAILRRVPLLHLTRLKLVSKTWCNYITQLRHSIPLTTSTGLVLFLRQTSMNPTLHESTFITVQEQTPQAQLRSNATHTFPYLIDSCHGLLLYAAHDGHYWTYYISSPLFNRCIPLPRAHELSRTARESIVFDGLCCRDQFKVVCHFWKEIDYEAGTISCQIFSSRTWKWREKQARIINSYLLGYDDFTQFDCFGHGVCSSKGRLYWIWSLCLLVYEDGRETFKLIELPKSTTKSLPRRQARNLSRLLWESEGLVHYCDLIDEYQGLYVWTYDDDDDEDDFDYKKGMDYSSRWRFKLHIVLDQQRKSRWRWAGGIAIRPCAFNEDLQVLYLQLPESIVAYSFETQEWAEVWNFGKQGENYFMCTIYPFLFNSVDFLLLRNR